MKLSLLSPALLAFALACGGSPAPTEPPPKPKAEAPAMDAELAKAVKIARAIDANPEKAKATLAENGMSEAELSELMYAIAEDPERAAAYEKARASR